MKAVALDCSSDYLYVAACNGDTLYTISSHKGLQHSADIVPALDTALSAVGLTARDLEFIACPQGPGSFTGLRLAFAAAKAIQMAAEIPLITVPTLNIWAKPFFFWNGLLLAAIDSKKNQFYVTAYRNSVAVSEVLDIPPVKLLSLIDPEEQVLITGPDASLLKEKLENLLPSTRFFTSDAVSSMNCAAQLLTIAAEKFAANPTIGINDYNGPLYIRKSEAEEALENRNGQ